ncbi:hypothetical protein MKW98_013390 [Papaver atlanticum]|uniref:Uncharacterized protein n=1 Tax=Papaver atlanticum TaxID=357466 RepID=A0AAD4XKJ6_9MAGN|nr:hypothetical protein MKW98_013390 [Papaver atlanticum]
MAKTTFSPLFIGLILVLMMLLSSEGVNAAGCVDIDIDMGLTRNSYSICQIKCTSLFGDKFLTFQVHDVNWFGGFKCACCYSD